MIDLLLADRRGNFAVLAALMMLPLAGAAALAVDYTAASANRVELFNATDGAALAIARAGRNVTQAEAEIIAADYIAGNFRGEVHDIVVQRDGSRWLVNATAHNNTIFAGIIGVHGLDVSTTSSAAYSLTTYEIALVLDTTGSMEGEKLRLMKDAAKTLVSTMSQDADGSGNLKFALVPFSDFVNVGPQFGPTFNNKGEQITAGASWLDRAGLSPVAQSELPVGMSRFQLAHHLGQPWSGCVETRPANGSKHYDVTDLASDGYISQTNTPVPHYDAHSFFVPAFSIDEPDGQDRWGRAAYPNQYLADNGAVVSKTSQDDKRKKLKDKYNVTLDASGKVTLGTKPSTDFSNSTFYSNLRKPKGPNFSCTSKPIEALTTDFDKIVARIDDLVALGGTNLIEGVMWGWRVLSPGEPFAEGRPVEEANNEKIMIFLTDGANAWNQMSHPTNQLGSAYSSVGYAVDKRLVNVNTGANAVSTAMNTKTLAGCTNAKAAGLTIYTIRLEVSDTNTGSLLSQCATSADHYFDVPDAKQLESTFDQIRERIQQVRITS